MLIGGDKRLLRYETGAITCSPRWQPALSAGPPTQPQPQGHISCWGLSARVQSSGEWQEECTKTPPNTSILQQQWAPVTLLSLSTLGVRQIAQLLAIR